MDTTNQPVDTPNLVLEESDEQKAQNVPSDSNTNSTQIALDGNSDISPESKPRTHSNELAVCGDPSTATSTKAGLTRKESSLSKVSSKSYQTLRSMATRIKVANRLSIARRTQTTEEGASISGGALPDDSSVKLFKDLSPSSIPLSSKLPSPRLFPSSPNSPSGFDQKFSEGIISRGHLVFDKDFKLPNCDASIDSRKPYIYVNSDVPIKNVTNVLFDVWDLPIPRIALFLLTDVGDLVTWNNSRQISAFKSGLMKAANTTSMLLVTNGLDVGVGKLIGDALEQEHKEMQTFRLFENRARNNALSVVAITNDHNLSYTQEFTGATINLGNPGPDPSEHRYELNQSHTSYVVLKSTNSSDDANQHLLIDFIDTLTKRIGLSPDHDHSCKDRRNPFFPKNYLPNKAIGVSQSPISPFASNSSQQPEIIVRHSGQSPHSDFPHTSNDLAFDTVDTGTEHDDDSDQAKDDISFVTRDGQVDSIGPTYGLDDGYQTITSSDENLNPSSKIEADLGGNRHSGKNASAHLNKSVIPVVCVVIQGDYHCAKLVLDNLRRRNPVIVLRGSGGFADLLSYAYIEMQQRCRDIYQTWDAEFVEQTLKPLLVTKIVKHFAQFRNNALARNIFRDRIIECVRESGSPKGRIYLSILNMHNSSCDLQNLSEFILLSLFKSQTRRDTLDANLLRKDLYLTLDWNCSHVALEEVLRRNPSYNLQLEKSLFEIALLRDDREDFIDLFLSHGFRVHKYLTPLRLKRLIRHSLVEQEFFRLVCMENILGITLWSSNFSEIIEKLTLNPGAGDSDSFIMNEFNQLIFTTTSLHNFVNVEHLYLNIMGLYPVDADSAERISLAILAMWAVFNRRFKLSEILWKHSDQPVHLALVISMMLERMAWFVAEQNLKDDLQSHSKVFAQFAIGVLDACYRHDEKRSFDLLSQENSDWHKKTAVDIAANGHHRAFIAHPCCQKWLTNTFNGRIRVRELSWGLITISPVIKIILSAFFIFPMYIWIRFLDDDQSFVVKKKLLEEFDQESDESDEDPILSQAADRLKLIQMNVNRSKTNLQEESVNLKENPSLNDPRWNNKSYLMLDTLKQLKDRERSKNGTNGSKDKSYYFHQRRLFIRKQPPLWTMINLMWNSPITKFWTFQVFYIFYLALFSLAVIWPGCGNWYLDTTVCFWTFLNLIEHARRSMVLYQRYTSVPMVFKIVEMLGLVIFLFIYSWGRVLIVYTYHIKEHHLSSYNIDPYSMKVILCLGLLYFYYRLFAIHLPISPTLGPLLYRFKLMVTVDFIHFMRMALILLFSSGIVIQAILYPNTELSIDMFHKAFHRAIISLFLTPVDELTVKCKHKENNTLARWFTDFNSSMYYDISLKSIFNSSLAFCPVEPISMADSCPRTGFWPYVFSFQYLIGLKLILMTLLYALFASTATKLQTETDNIWKYQRYILVIDFANRPALHAPLSVFEYLYWFIRLVYRFFTCNLKCNLKRFCSHSDQMDNKNKLSPNMDDPFADEGGKPRLSKEDYNFWRYLSKVFYEQELKKKEKSQLINKQTDTIQIICEEMEHEKNILRTLKTKITEMERLMYQTQIHLESIKHSTTLAGAGQFRAPGGQMTATVAHTTTASGSITPSSQHFHKSTIDLSVCTSSKSIIHFLSRHSPYPGTRIQRFPIADKFVSWDVIWINYDPVIFSRKREDFASVLKPFVDEDVLALKEQLNAITKREDTSDVSSSSSHNQIHLPVFNWNAVSVNPAGLTIDRRSWIQQETQIDCFDSSPSGVLDEQHQNIIYKLDEGIPLNPFGRTGLRGKGNLARWGPNHYVMLILTRSRFTVGGGVVVQFALEHKYNSLFLPMRFVGDEKLFAMLRPLFAKCESSPECPQGMNIEWNSEQDMMDYFRLFSLQSTAAESGTSLVQFESPQVFYVDSPENTDNAWKEMRVYHVHFAPNADFANTESLLAASSNMIWLNYTEDLLVRLPMEQISFMNSAVRKFQVATS